MTSSFFINMYFGVYLSRCSYFASLAFLVYDWFITLNDEMAYIWKQRWSVVRALFILNRYFPMLFLFISAIVPMPYCRVYLRWGSVTSTITLLISQVILMLRIYAIYDRNKKILVFMIMTCSLEMIAASILLYKRNQTLIRLIQDPPLPLGCSVFISRSRSTGQLKLAMVPQLGFETILFVLSSYKAYGLYRQSVPQCLLATIIRDSVYYYFSIFFVLFMNTLVFYVAPPYVFGPLLSWLWTVPCIVGSRLILHVRKRAYDRGFTLSSMTPPVNCDTIADWPAECVTVPKEYELRIMPPYEH